MFWGAIGSHGKSELVKVEGRMDSAMYQNLISRYLLPVSVAISSPVYIFQQDGASSHRSASTLAFFNRQNVQLLDWPAYSPDMNIIENLWGFMARAVYPDGKQYRDVASLETSCRDAWNDITQEMVTRLFDSMDTRVTQLYNANGGPTNY
jgi:hypothetical protein